MAKSVLEELGLEAHMDYLQIGKELGISSRLVSKIEKSALDKLRKWLIDNGVDIQELISE